MVGINNGLKDVLRAYFTKKNQEIDFDFPKVGKLGASAEEAGKNNVSFLSYFLLGDLEKCLEILITSNRVPEAAFFARCPYRVSHLLREIFIFLLQDISAI